ncbi:MAG: MerR family transcriptional regulator [Anaerolineales bacterium]|nr:MerR family transcriptional regulator [Anaerolineales bacterium]
MLKIGDFSKLSRVTVKTLRYYDEIGLLKPAQVDRFTGYRYYSFKQLPRLNRILALKDLGLSLEQIGRLLDEELPSEQLRGMLRLKWAEIEGEVTEAQAHLARVEARLRQIEQEVVMSKYDVIIKKVELLKVASMRGVVPTPPDQGTLWNELEGYLATHGVRPAGPCLSLYHDDEYKEKDWDIEVCEPIDAELPASQRIKVQQLPGVETIACVVHHGPFTTIGEAYDAIMKWIDENGYRISGSSREIYLQSPAEPGTQDDPNTVTEVQFPVAKG